MTDGLFSILAFWGDANIDRASEDKDTTLSCILVSYSLAPCLNELVLKITFSLSHSSNLTSEF